MTGMVHSADTPATPTSLDIWEQVTGVIGTSVSALAVIVGAVWVYFRFIKDRTYRPRLDVALTGGWVQVLGARRLHLIVTAKNSGATVTRIHDEGTSLSVQTLQKMGSTVGWESENHVFDVFAHESSVEPGETVRDDMVLPTPYEEAPVRVQAQVIITRRGRFGGTNIAIQSLHIVWPHDLDSTQPDDGATSATTSPTSKRE